ncbi:MAG: Crp/Fnr family transcriptional regulator [Dehalococcoidia bacterium]|nr:Crp/Fnr family transcriptional regulator [Dehalococcoidia bacterium]
MTPSKNIDPRVHQAVDSLDLFHGLNAKARNGLTQTARVARYPAGASILKAGEVPQTFYVLLRGRVGVQIPSQRTESSFSAMTDILEAGECIGLVSHLTDTSLVGNALAVEDCECLLVPPDVFLDLARSNADISLRLQRDLAKRVHHARTWLTKLL